MLTLVPLGVLAAHTRCCHRLLGELQAQAAFTERRARTGGGDHPRPRDGGWAAVVLRSPANSTWNSRKDGMLSQGAAHATEYIDKCAEPSNLPAGPLPQFIVTVDTQHELKMHSSSLGVTRALGPPGAPRSRAPVRRRCPAVTRTTLMGPRASARGAQGTNLAAAPLPQASPPVRAAAGSSNNALPYLRRIERLDTATLHSEWRNQEHKAACRTLPLCSSSSLAHP